MQNLTYMLCLIFKLVWVSYANDVCHQPFGQFLKCASSEAQKRLGVFELEATPYVQNKIKSCFTRSGCEPPNFSHATLEHLLPQAWSERMALILDLLEHTKPPVQTCMVQYFTGMATRKVETCIRQHGGPQLRNFHMPELPEIQGLNFTSLKHSVLNRVVVLTKTMECSDSVIDDSDLQAVINCQKTARSENPTSICHVRDRCRANTIDTSINCKSRFDKVQAAACKCFQNEREKDTGNNLKSWKEMFNSLFKGGMARQYKQCCLQNNVEFPEEKVRAVDDAFRNSLRDVILNGLPERVQSVVNQLMKQVSDEGQKVFCDNCAQTASGTSANSDAKFVRKLVAAQRNPQKNLVTGGLKGFLDGLKLQG